MTRFRALALPLLMTAVGLAVLVGLGTWQLERREWKLALIERIEARAHADPLPLAAAKRRWEESGDIEYLRLALTGRFLHDQERHLYTIVDGRAGWQVITPLQTPGGEIVLVDRGFVPEERKDAAARREGQVQGSVRLTGLARAAGRPSWFTPDNRPDLNRWFWRDIPGMTASLPPALGERAAPFVVEAEAAPVPGGWPRGGVTRLALPNRHLEYAITWFGLAAALIAVFALYARRRLSQAGSAKDNAGVADQTGSV
jgi:surfeit locus 1 family protein